MVSSEAVPFAKTGGLADVCGTLPSKLASLGHRVSIFLPAYQRVFHSGIDIQPTEVGFIINMAGHPMSCRILRARMAQGVDVYFIDQPHYFDRPHLYGDHHGDYRDNCERFCFFSRSCAQAITSLRLPVDILHCHDWQAGLLPAYVRTQRDHQPWYTRVKTIMTIHNLAYQGRFWHHDMSLTGIDWQHFNWQEMEFFGDLCLLKSGIVFADKISTVSPTYAVEIQTPAHGCGLDGVLRSRSSDLIGIVNGVDYDIWDPLRDRHLEQPYSVENWKHGKAVAKATLQRELGLPVQDDVPLIGIIGRLADQKGWDLIIPMLRNRIENDGVQWAILGSGEARYQDALHELASHAPHRLAARLEFSEPLSHRIEAGSDMFLMPSRYEPCGLNQLYSLRYGTIPIVHATGGLVDTVVDAHAASIQDGTATGFVFHHYDQESLEQCIRRACDTYQRESEQWNSMVEQGMRQDWSWGKSAQRYDQLYNDLHHAPGRSGN